MPPKIFLSAAEVSGDVHGARLAKEIKLIEPDTIFYGVGGEQMLAAGVDVWIDITEKSTIGLLEVLRYLPSHIRTYNKIKKILKDTKPDAVILIDAQGFNLPVAKAAKALGIKTIYYIPPQEWLWGTKKGAKKVVETIDLIAAIFEKEAKFYKEAGGNVVFHGHPIIDMAVPKFSKEKVQAAATVRPGAPYIGIFPGSRRQEIEGLLPMMLDAVKIIEKEVGKVNLLLGLSSSKFKDRIEKIIQERKQDIFIFEKGTIDALAYCDVNIAASGTIVLESAVVGAPVVMTYKLSPLTYFIGKYILKVTEKLPYYSMPNLLANERIVPELILKDATPNKVAKEALNLLQNKDARDKMQKGFEKVRFLLGKPGAVNKVAKDVLSFVSSK